MDLSNSLQSSREVPIAGVRTTRVSNRKVASIRRNSLSTPVLCTEGFSIPPVPTTDGEACPSPTQLYPLLETPKSAKPDRKEATYVCTATPSVKLQNPPRVFALKRAQSSGTARRRPVSESIRSSLAMQVIEPESSHFVSGIYCGPSIECDNRDNESAAKLFKQFSPPVTTSNSRTQSRRPSKENELWMIGGGDAYLSRASSLLSAHQKPRSAAATPPAASRASSFFSINSLGNSGNSGSMTNNRFSSPPPSKNNDVHASLSRRELLKTSVTNSPTRSSNLKSFLAKISNSLASIPRPKAPKPECMSSRSLQQENSPNARLDRNLSGGNVSDNQAAPDTIAIMMAMKELIESLSKFRTEQYELTRTVQYERECRIKLEKDVAAISEKLKTLVSNSEHVATLSLPQRES